MLVTYIEIKAHFHALLVLAWSVIFATPCIFCTSMQHSTMGDVRHWWICMLQMNWDHFGNGLFALSRIPHSDKVFHYSRCLAFCQHILPKILVLQRKAWKADQSEWSHVLKISRKIRVMIVFKVENEDRTDRELLRLPEGNCFKLSYVLMTR